MPHRRGLVLAVGVLVFSLLLTFIGWRYASEREAASARAEFIAHCEEIASLLRERMGNHEIVLKGGASLFASIQQPTPLQWRAYAEGMNLRNQFPAMVGLGYAAYVPQARLDDLQLEWKARQNTLLEIVPHGDRRHYGPILMLEPKTPENLAAIGFDMYAEPVRREAMEAAMVTGLPRLSGTVQLVQDGGLPSTATLLYMPVYRNGTRPSTVIERQRSLLGWVYMPFRIGVFVNSTLEDNRGAVHFTITDVTDGAEQLLYSSAPQEAATLQRHEIALEQFGRNWLFRFESPVSTSAIPAGVMRGWLLFGIVASLMLATIVFTMARTEHRAMRMAYRMTEEYRRSEERFRTTMLHSAIGKALLDSEGCIVEVNPAMGQIVGLRPAALVGVQFESLFEDQGLDVIEWLNKDDGDEAAPVLRTTRRLHRAGDLARHAQLTYARVPGGVGQDVKGLVQAEDVTERILAEARVHALNRTLEARVAARTRELSQANQELESFAYSISHDLRAPLRAIDGFSRILVEKFRDSLGDTGKGYLDRVRAAAGRMDELIDALLKMSRVTRTSLSPGKVDLSRMALDVLDEFKAGDPGHAPELVVEPGLTAWGDPTLLRNMLSNLLGNAWKFTRGTSGPRIEFGAGQLPSGEREFRVQDNGAGFPQKHVEKLFRPFQRLHGQDEFAGHGIGLASVKRIIERHGGSIRAEGHVGEGAAFFFTLPAGDEPPPRH